jgi:hypothetical protein
MRVIPDAQIAVSAEYHDELFIDDTTPPVINTGYESYIEADNAHDLLKTYFPEIAVDKDGFKRLVRGYVELSGDSIEGAVARAYKDMIGEAGDQIDPNNLEAYLQDKLLQLGDDFQGNAILPDVTPVNPEVPGIFKPFDPPFPLGDGVGPVPIPLAKPEFPDLPVNDTPGVNPNREGGALGGGDPLTIDLNRNGLLDVSSLEDSATFFDYDGDGLRERTAWLRPNSGDGILAIDLDGDGRITTSAEMFGPPQPLVFIRFDDDTRIDDVNGFALLSAYDENGDGMITPEDAVWDNLVIWEDANADAFTQDSELNGLDHYAMAGIETGASLVTREPMDMGGFRRRIEDNPVSHSASVLFTDGDTT